MDNIRNFLENLRPGGASNVPTSRLQQNLTEDELSDNNANEPEQFEPTKKRRSLFKQQADANHYSSEFEELNTVPEKQATEKPVVQKEKIEKPIVETKIAKPNPTPRQTIPDQPQLETEDERIKRIWKELGIGGDGYLTLPELERVCNHIGMNELDRGDLQTLFNTIDTDNDGKVSLSEFSEGLKGQGGLNLPGNKSRRGKRRPRTNSGKLNENEDNPFPNHSLFSSLDPNRKGFSDAQKIIEYWASGGILNGNEVLEFFDVNFKKPINLVQLSAVLEEEMFLTDLDAITLTGLISMKKELHYCRSMLEMMQIAYNRNIDRKDDKRPDGSTGLQEIQSRMLAKDEAAKAAYVRQKSQYEAAINQLRQQLAELSEEFTQVQFENSELKNRVLELEDISTRQEEELDAVAELHRKMDLELKILRDAKLTFSQSLTQRDRDELYDLKSKLEQQIEQNQQNHLMESTSLKSGVKGYKNGNMSNDEVKNQIEVLNQKLHESSTKVNNLEYELNNKSKEVDELKATAEKLATTMDSHFHQFNTRHKENDKSDHTDEIKQLKSHLSDVNKEKSILESQLQDLKDRLGKFEFENKELLSENESLKERVKGLKNKIDIAVNRESSYQNRIKANSSSSEDKVLELERVIRKNQSELDDVNRQMKTTTNELSDKQDEIDQLKRKLDRLNKDYEALVDENNHLTTKIRKADADLYEAQEKLREEKRRKIFDSKESDLSMHEKEELNEQLDSVRNELKTKKFIVDKLETANERLSHSLQNAIDKFDMLKNHENLSLPAKSYIAENIRLSQQNIRLEDEINKLSMKVTNFQASDNVHGGREIQKLQRELNLKEKKINNLERLSKHCPDDHLSQTYSDKFRSLKKQDYLQFQFDELNKKYKIQLEQVDKTDSLLKEVYEENARLLRSLQKSEDHRHESEIRVLTLEEKVKTLQSVVNRFS